MSCWANKKSKTKGLTGAKMKRAWVPGEHSRLCSVASAILFIRTMQRFICKNARTAFSRTYSCPLRNRESPSLGFVRRLVREEKRFRGQAGQRDHDMTVAKFNIGNERDEDLEECDDA